jgi:hypothetical protein
MHRFTERHGAAPTAMLDSMTKLRPYDPHRKVEILGDLWRATREDHTLRVQLRTHPMGWELRAFVGLEMHRSAVAKEEAEIHATSNQWKEEALGKGWHLAEEPPSTFRASVRTANG